MGSPRSYRERHERCILLERSRALVVAAWATLVSQIVIVGTGGAVRLTGSGLGCSEWPNCTPESFTPVPEQGIHGIIEFTNRVWGGIVVLIAVAHRQFATMSSADVRALLRPRGIVFDLKNVLPRGAAERPLANQPRALVAGQGGGKNFGAVRRAVVGEKHGVDRDRAVAGELDSK